MDKRELDLAQEFPRLREDWEVIRRILPDGWEAQARATRAFVRDDVGFDSAATLLRVLLIHLSDGCSLRETAVRAREGGLAAVSDVALFKRLRRCGAWFSWMVQELAGHAHEQARALLPQRRLVACDGSIVCEPGATGSTWRLHYAFNLSTLQCEQAIVTPVDQGESLVHFAVRPGDVLIADRAFAKRRGIRHAAAHDADVIVRINLDNAPMHAEDGTRIDLLPGLRRLSYGQIGEWHGYLQDAAGSLAVRVCAIKKSAAQAARSQQKLLREARKKHRRVKPETLEATGYFVVQTTLMDEPASTIMELYRHRWQIELEFKRLKSLLQLGHLKKTDSQGARAWLQGKLLVALLIDKLLDIGEHFSPWGYLPRSPLAPDAALPMAGDQSHACPAQPRHQPAAVVTQAASGVATHRHSAT
jgi:hypothetical protein